jgi:DNA recombination-dependent growth factor C
VGWVEILDPLNMDFPPTSWRFGPLIAMSLRVDTRKLSNKVLKRYLTMAAAQAESDTGKPLSTRDRQELKHRVREELLSRTPVNTDIYEVGWFPEAAEVWLVGAGSAKVRERFEEWWRHTFNLGLIMKIPFVQARIKGPEGAEDALDRLRPSALFGGGED